MYTRSLLLALLFLLLGGCLEFDAQDVTVVYDAKADRIDIHLVYRGLFVESGSGSTDRPMEKALEDLAKVRDRGVFYFWCNYPFSFDLAGKLKGPVQALANHVDVENGALFTDEKGVLCGHQFVRIREARAFAQKLNTILELGAQVAMSEPIREGGTVRSFDDDTKEALREFLRSGSRLLQIEPGRIEVRLPCSAADHAWLKQRLEQYFLENAPREMVRRVAVDERRAADGDRMDTTADPNKVAIEGAKVKDAVHDAASLRFFWDNDWSFVREEDLTRVALGVKGADRLVVRKAGDGLYHDALLTALRAKGEAIEEKIGAAELERRFAAFRGRDAVLPPALAAVRTASKPEQASEAAAETK